MIRYFNIILFTLISLKSFSQEEDLYSYDNSLKFARYLNASNQQEFASQEYERLNYLFPNDSVVVKELITTYRLDKKCNMLNKSFSLLTKENEFSDLPQFQKEYLNFSLTCHSFDESYYESVAKLKENEKRYYILSSYWMLNDYKKVLDFTKSHHLESENYESKLFILSENFQQVKYKNPTVALLMSTIVPGSGKAYTKNWNDAIIAFIFVGSNAYLSYRSFSQKGIKSTNGWIFGGFAFSFYSANIWGSYQSAKKYNHKINSAYQNNAENIIYNNF